MTVKLVRIDTDDALKIELPLGENEIGRGKLLDCDDKRISRHHGKLNVNEDSLIITALHQNPCFYKKKGLKNTEILRQDNMITLINGDRFGLLPDAFWYEVLYIADPEAMENCESNKNTQEYPVGNDDCDNRSTSNDSDADNMKTFNLNSDDGFHKEIAELNSLPFTEPIIPLQSVSDKTSESAESGPNKEGESNVLNEPNLQSDPNVPNEQNEPNVNTEPNVQNEQAIPLNNEEQNNESNSNKRCRSPDNSDVKKIKTEPVQDNAENSDDVKPGPSLLNQGQMAPPNDGGADTSAPDNNPPRERCIYGATCYRKNPQHLAQFSHPRDADWGRGERGVCPYGAACVKTDPRHWRAHDHPPGKLPPARPGMQVVERHGNVYFINARTVNFYDDRFQVEDSDGDSVDYDYEF